MKIALFITLLLISLSAQTNRLDEWDALMNSQALSEIDKLQAVNTFFNRIEYRRDQDQWGKADYWASPEEFLTVGAGDCEDFAIAKYITLKKMGVSAETLFLTYVITTEPHMVLLYQSQAESLVLDNVVQDIQPAHNLNIVYQFNDSGIWMNGKRVGDVSNIGNWIF